MGRRKNGKQSRKQKIKNKKVTKKKLLMEQKKKKKNDEKKGSISGRGVGVQGVERKKVVIMKNSAPRGLVNLGNTCFFNAVTQCLMQVERLQRYFLVEEEEEIGEMKELEGFGMMLQMRKTMDAVLRGDQRGAYSPQGLLGEIGKRAPRFRGRNQQDAHEALRFVLDGLIEEEQKREKERVEEDGEEDEEKRVKEGYLERAFKGTLVSTITCRECCSSSSVTEPFYDLSVPLVPASASDASSTKDVSASSTEPSATAAQETSLIEASTSQAVIPLPPPPSMSHMSPLSQTASSDGEAIQEPMSFQEELMQKVKPASPAMSDIDDAEDIPLLSSDPVVMEVDDETDVEEGFAGVSDIFDSDPLSFDSNPIPDPADPLADSSTSTGVTSHPSAAQQITENNTTEASTSKSSRLFSLPFSSFRRGTKYGSLTDSVAEFTRTEVLEGSNAYGCEECTRRKQRALRIARAKEFEDSMSAVTSEENLVNAEARDSGLTPYPGLGLEDEGITSPITSSESDTGDEDDCAARSDVSSDNEDDMRQVSSKLAQSEMEEEAEEEKSVPTVRTTAEKRLEIRSAPPCLIVQLKRFQQLSLRGAPRKVSGHVDFPEQLDLQAFMEKNSLKRGSASKKDSSYCLVGVVEHGGSLFGGHYTSYVRSMDGDGDAAQWYYCNDSRVSKTDLKNVLGAEAYVLVYEKQ